MTERPILFSGPMVRAILDGRKTQTRRVVKPHPSGGWEKAPYVQAGRWCSGGCVSDLKCPYGQPGDRLWVREAWAMVGDNTQDAFACPNQVYFRADTGTSDDLRWRQSIHMPRWASRIMLEVVSVRVERVRDITEADAIAEGAPDSGQCNRPHFNPGEAHRHRLGFANIWDAINAKHGAGWDANPWVWVIEFRRVDKEA